MSTTDNLVVRGTRLAVGAGALTTAVALGASLLAAAPAQATTPSKPKPYGTVVSKGGMHERVHPSTDSSVAGYLPHRAQIGLVCKIRAQDVMGNTVWYLTGGTNRGQRKSWVSAKFVANTGVVKYCKDVSGKQGPGHTAKHAVG
ncbi:SH3 domain-containing protein [Streptomyces halobius]|uniref:SH3 domain-containing protein n=1 Tax=Streptomyces halobius TaxID=2879846 RepID=A0ABY4MHD5_9ACTN|nr:SH3 domain-containing protein [Streptomyces halobius]UQA96772.1 SH3 domain-containing protein [Streptomyces halobius]